MIKSSTTARLNMRGILNLKGKLITLVVLVAAILAVDSVFIHFIFPIKKQKMIQEMNSEVQKSLLQNPPVEQHSINEL